MLMTQIDSPMPRHSPFVLAPAAGALYAVIAYARVPVAIRFFLVGGDHLKREGFAVFERRTSVQPQARTPHQRQMNSQHITFLA